MKRSRLLPSVALAALLAVPGHGISAPSSPPPSQRFFDNSRALTGDLDGDGFNDVATLTALQPAVRGSALWLIRAFSGRTGSVLWTMPLQAEGAVIVGARVGPLAGAGVVVGFTQSNVWSLTAINAAGVPVWTWQDPLHLGYPGYLGAANVVQLAQAASGAADDIVIERVTRVVTDGITSSVTATGFEIIDGRFGVSVQRMVRPPELDAVDSRVGVVGDMDGDTLQDIVLYTESTDASRAQAYSSSTSKMLWERRFAQEQYLVPKNAGDLNRDGRDDVILGWDGEAHLVSATGALITSFTGTSSVLAPGDLIRDGKAAVLVTRRTVSSTSVCAVFEGLTLSPRRLLYRKTRCLPTAPGETSNVNPSQPAGDIDGDNVGDYRFYMWVCGQGCRNDGGFVSGRTGEYLRAQAEIANLFFASVDGRGDDLFALGRPASPASTMPITIYDGRTGGTVWMGSCDSAIGGDGSTDWFQVLPVIAAGTRRVNVLCDMSSFSVDGVETRRLTMLRGADGTRLWAATIAPIQQPL